MSKSNDNCASTIGTGVTTLGNAGWSGAGREMWCRVALLLVGACLLSASGSEGFTLKVGSGTFLGGSEYDHVTSVAFDATGNIYLTGLTSSADFPGVHLHPVFGHPETNMFVTKLDGRTGRVVYSLVIGGSNHEFGGDIAVDHGGAAYVAGTTFSSDFPVTTVIGAPTSPGLPNAFLMKIGPAGVMLSSATVGGAIGSDYGAGVAVGCGAVGYLTGNTQSPDFPASNLPSIEFTGNMAYLMAFDPVSMAVQQPVIVAEGESAAVACRTDGAAYIAGLTTRGMVTQTGFSRDASDTAAFVARIEADGEVGFERYFGGNGYNRSRDVTVGSDGSVVVVGTTSSTDFPVTGSSPRPSNVNDFDPFVARVRGDGSIVYVTDLKDGYSYEEAWSITTDSLQRAWVAGFNSQDAFVALVGPSGQVQSRTKFAVGPNVDQAFAIATGPSDQIYVAGATASEDFPVAPDGLQPNLAGVLDGFVLNIAIEFSRGSALHITTPNTPSRWGVGTTQRIAWTYDGDFPQFLIEISRDSGKTWNSLTTVANASGNSQNFNWIVAGPLTSAAKFRVAAIGDSGATDINDVDIRIANASVEILTPTTSTSVALGSTLAVRYRHSLGARAPVAIEVSADNGLTWRTAAETITTGSTTSSFLWTVDLLPTTRARIRVRALDGTAVNATSGAFTVTAGP